MTAAIIILSYTYYMYMEKKGRERGRKRERKGKERKKLATTFILSTLPTNERHSIQSTTVKYHHGIANT